MKLCIVCIERPDAGTLSESKATEETGHGA